MSSEAIPSQFEDVDAGLEENVSDGQEAIQGDTKPQEFYYLINTEGWQHLVEIMNEELTVIREASKDLNTANYSLEMYAAKRMSYDSIEAFVATILDKVNAEAESYEKELKDREANSQQ